MYKCKLALATDLQTRDTAPTMPHPLVTHVAAADGEPLYIHTSASHTLSVPTH